MSAVRLAIGTAQFGMAYGIAGAGKAVSEDEARKILEIVAKAGVETLDTAPGYGDIEQRLAMLCDSLPFSVVSKIPAFPTGMSRREVRSWIAASVSRSQQRLGGRLRALLFHRGGDLLSECGDEAWRAATDALSPNVRLGVSAYSPEEVSTILQRFPVTIAQLPGSALDQRLRGATGSRCFDGVELHLRSVFLQGLLLMDPSSAARRVTTCAGLLHQWQGWCRHRELSRTVAALSIARGLPSVGTCVVGLDSAAQATEIVTAWSAAEPMEAPELASSDLDVIDPRRWMTA